MGRNVDLIEDWVDYTPEIDGNRDDDEPMVVELKPLSGEQMRAYGRQVSTRHNRVNEIVRGQKLVTRILSDRVRNVRNYQVGDDRIETGDQLAKHGETVVIDEIFDALTEMSVLREGLPGKSRSRSDSSSRGTARPGNGAAVDAKAMTLGTGSDQSATATTTKTKTSPGHGPPDSVDARGHN